MAYIIGFYIRYKYNINSRMAYRLALIPVIAMAVKVIKGNGGVQQLTSFRVNPTLINGIIVNLLTTIIFAELYWRLDSKNDHKHFGFNEPLDAYYYVLVTNSTIGYGEITPKTRLAKSLVMSQITIMFFTVVPIIAEALKPGN